MVADGLHGVVQKLSLVVMWLAFGLCNCLLATLTLAVFWATGTEAKSLLEWLLKVMPGGPLAMTATVLGVLGLSLGALLTAWWRFWRWLWCRTVVPWLIEHV